MALCFDFAPATSLLLSCHASFPFLFMLLLLFCSHALTDNSLYGFSVDCSALHCIADCRFFYFRIMFHCLALHCIAIEGDLVSCFNRYCLDVKRQPRGDPLPTQGSFLAQFDKSSHPAKTNYPQPPIDITVHLFRTAYLHPE